MDIDEFCELEERLVGVISRLIRVEDAILRLTENLNGEHTMSEKDDRTSMSDTGIKMFTVKVPQICDSCIEDAMLRVADNPDQNQLYHHCPHIDTLAHLRLEQHQGRPAITQWILQGPLPQAEAVKIIKSLGESMDAQVTLLTGSQRVN